MRNPWGHKEWNGDWSDESDLWTDELKEELEMSAANDGIFFISLDDYIENYNGTSYAFAGTPGFQRHSHHIHDFNDGHKIAYFTFDIDETINCEEELFCISAVQQGDTYPNARAKQKDCFSASSFGLMLATEDGRFIKGFHGGAGSFNAGICLTTETLLPGKYVITLDPTWNAFAESHGGDYKKMAVSVYSSCLTKVQPLSQKKGFALLVQTMKSVARDHCPAKSRTCHRKQNKDYGDQVYRVIDTTSAGMWMGFVYINNQSGYQLRETYDFT